MPAIPDSFWGATAQIGFVYWPFFLQILKFLWIAKSFSTCPSAFHILKLCCISSNLLFLLFPLTSQIYGFKYFTVTLVGFWLRIEVNMWIKLNMLNEINAYDWLCGILEASHSDMIKVLPLLNSPYIEHLAYTFLKKFTYFIYFIFGFVGSSLLCAGFL